MITLNWLLCLVAQLIIFVIALLLFGSESYAAMIALVTILSNFLICSPENPNIPRVLTSLSAIALIASICGYRQIACARSDHKIISWEIFYPMYQLCPEKWRLAPEIDTDHPVNAHLPIVTYLSDQGHTNLAFPFKDFVKIMRLNSIKRHEITRTKASEADLQRLQQKQARQKRLIEVYTEFDTDLNNCRQKIATEVSRVSAEMEQIKQRL